MLGQPLRKDRKDRAKRLPCAHELFPSIVHARADRRDRMPACSAAEAISLQEPYINSTIANHVLALLARLFRHGRIAYHGGFVNLATGRVTPLAVDPATWPRLRVQAEKERAYLTRRPRSLAARRSIDGRALTTVIPLNSKRRTMFVELLPILKNRPVMLTRRAGGRQRHQGKRDSEAHEGQRFWR